jgi:uncharacterized protein (TIGR03435 family)
MKSVGMVLLTAVVCASGQTPSFEVASIKVNHSGSHMVGIQPQPGGRFGATNVNLKLLITFAYGIKESQLSDVPSWVDSERYDISAKPETTASFDEMKLMLQALLVDRFKLRFRKETKELPVYVLVVAKNGPKLEEWKDNGEEPKPEPGRGGMGRGRGMRVSPGQLMAQGAAVSDFANQLSTFLGRNVIDKTGLTGKFNFNLKWTPDESQAAMFKGPGDGGGREGGPPPADSNGPSIFSAIQDQLGLKLDSQKGPVDVYVIASVEKPSEN